MIQRIQTIYLALAAIAMFLTFAFPFGKLTVGMEEYLFDASGMMVNGKNIIAIPYGIIAAVLGTIMLTVIFLYKKRTLQMKINRMLYILLLAYFFLLIFSLSGASAKIPMGEHALKAYGVALYFPMGALAMIFMANVNIMRDEKLVRSLDRLR